MTTYMVTIRETSGEVLTPSYSASEEFWAYNDPREFLTQFFGLEKPDVEGYDIQRVELTGGSLVPVEDLR